MLVYIAEDPRVDVPATTVLAGLPIAERVVRAARRAGYQRMLVYSPRTPLAGVARVKGAGGTMSL